MRGRQTWLHVDRGFTLMEMMVSTAILSVALGISLVALNTATVETTLGTADAVLQDAANRFAETLVVELRSASRSRIFIKPYDTDVMNVAPTTDFGAGGCITFQVPVDSDPSDGVDSVIDAAGNPVFGATVGAPRIEDKDSYIVYRFVPNQVGGVAEELDEVEDEDLNGDFDTDDKFMRGQFTRTVFDSANNVERRTRAVSDRWFLLEEDDPAGLPGAPLFQRQADGTITIELWIAQVLGRARTPVRAHVVTSVRPYNQ